MTQIATDPDQSSRLIACDVDPKSADFVWMDDKPNNPSLTLRTEIIEDNNPYILAFAWSLWALLALSPKEITDDNGDSYYLSIAQQFPLSYEYGVSYKPCWSDGDAIMRERDNCPIEACVQMIEWLVDNGYKLNVVE